MQSVIVVFDKPPALERLQIPPPELSAVFREIVQPVIVKEVKST